ncbi:streptococcal hemagglutinin-like [Eurosta solidaginis]|uniref:streptococcal hemagglutinin-like n=1 Tax=Eurosta solidaginis TaxID=178769 RepID=UPI003530709F
MLERTTVTKTSALSVNVPPVLDIGNDLINDNYNKSAHLLIVGSELGANNVDNIESSNNKNNSKKSKLSAARPTTMPSPPKKTANTAPTSCSIVISETIQLNHPSTGDELTNSKTKIPSSSDLTTLDFEEALDSGRSDRSVDQESLLATHIIFKPALNVVSPTTPTRRKYTRRKPIAYQTNGNELSCSPAVKVKEEKCEVDCLSSATVAVNVGDNNGVEVKNEALAWAQGEQLELEVAAMSAETNAVANTAFITSSPTKQTVSCEQPAKRARERGDGEEDKQHNDACQREKREGDQRETEAEIASAAVFMDTRHAYFTANEEDATTAANSCDAHILIGRYGVGGGNVVKAISDEATNAMYTSWQSNVENDLVRPAVVANFTMERPMDVVDNVRTRQEKPISGQEVAITMGWNQTLGAMAGATEVCAGLAVTEAPANDVQSSKQILEAPEISNLPILAATKQTTTCNNETVKDDDAAASQIIVSETDAAKAVAAAAIEDNNKAVITGNTLKSSLDWSLSMRNANDVSKDKGYFGRHEHRLLTDERRFAVENNVAVTDVDGDDVKGVETLMTTVELRPQTTETTKIPTATQSPSINNNQIMKFDAATTTHSEEMILRLKETETQTDLETSDTTSNAAFSSSTSSAFVTKAALKAYSTSPKCRSFARRHMHHKLRRTFKGPIAHLLASSPSSTSAAAAAFTAMHYKKKQIRRSISLTHLISERKDDATPASAAITTSTDSTTGSSSNGMLEEAISTSPQPTFSYYATAHRGRRRLKWRERSRLPYFDKHMHQHVNLEEVESAATINNDVQADNESSQTTATTQELPSCFVHLRRLENSELSDKPTTTLVETKENAEQAQCTTNDKRTTDVSMTDAATSFEGEFEAITIIGSNDDDGSTRITLKRKLHVDEIERLSSTRSPWRTKAEMKESLQQQAALEKAKVAEETDEQLTLYTQDVVKRFGTYRETGKADMSFTETCATDGDSVGTTSGLERRSKRIKKRRKMWEEAHKSNATTASSSDGKVMPIILKLVQEKRPDGCLSCTPKSETTSTAAQLVRGALVSKMSAARYHVVGAGNISQPQGDEPNTVVPQKRRRHRPKRSCCRDGCMTHDTTEDDSATTVRGSYQTSRLLPPPSIGKIKGGKMIIDNVNILNAKTCVESTKENCDNNKKGRPSPSDVSTTTSMTFPTTSYNLKTNKISLPSQLVPLLPLLPALLPTSSSAQTHKKDDAAQQQFAPTKTSPATPMSLKTFSSLVSTSSKAVLHTSPVKSNVTPNKDSVQSSSAATAVETVLSSPKSTLSSTNSNPVSVLLRNQLIVRVPLSALSAEFKRKFCPTNTSVQNTPINAGPTVSTENVLAYASPKKTTSPQATTGIQGTEISHDKLMACGEENTAHAEHNNKKHNSNNNTCSDENNSSKSATALNLESTAATAATTSSTKATISTHHLSTETAGDKQTQSASGGDINTSKCNSQHTVQGKDMNTQFMRGDGGGNSRYESEQSDFMGFSDGTGSSPNGHKGCTAKSNSNSGNNDYSATTTNLHDIISEIAPDLADDESEAPQANELQATLPAGEVTVALLAEAEAEAETRSPLHATTSHTSLHAQTPQRTQLLSETNFSEMQDVETTLSGILNEMQDQHIYTPVSSSADDFFAQSVYSPLSEPPATPTHSMYAESPLGGIGNVGSSSMAGGGGSLSVASSPYVQHIHMESGSVSSGQMSEPSPLPAPISVGPSPHHHPHHHQQQQAAAGYSKQYANKYGECFTEDSTQSELIGFQNDIPCFENIELVATAAKTASSSPNGQNEHDVEKTKNGGASAVAVAEVAAIPAHVDSNCKVVDEEASPVHYIAVAESSEANDGIALVCAAESQTPGLATSEGDEGIAGKEYAVDNATLAQLLNDFEATERETIRREEEERLRKQKEIEDEQQPQLVQAHLVEQQLMEQQLVQVEVVQAQQAMQQQQIPQSEVLLQRQQHHNDDMLKHQQLLQHQKDQEHLMRQQLLEQQQRDQLMQQQQLLDQQQRLQQQQHQQMYEQQRKQQQRPQIYNQTLVATSKHAPTHARSGQQHQQKQHYVTLPPSCAYEAAQMQLAQAADPIQPMHNLGMGVNLYAHNIVPGQEIQWTSSADLTNLSPTFIEAPGASGGTTTYYINAADLYQPNVIATQEQQHLPSLHHHPHQPQQQQLQLREQQLDPIELEKCSIIDANEDYIESMPDGGVAIQRQSCQQQQQQQQQQIMIVIPQQEYGTPGAGSTTAQLYTTTGTPHQVGTTYHLSQTPQTVIMQHGQPQALQMSGPQFISAQSTQRVGHHNATTPSMRPSNTLGRPLRCASTPSASNYQHRHQQAAQVIRHPRQLQIQQRQQQMLQQQQLQQHQQIDSPKMRMAQHLRSRQQALQKQQQQQLIQPHSQSRPQGGVTTAANGATPAQKVNLVCRFCHKRPKFTSNLDYSNHIIAMHPVETPYNCPYCPMHFTRRVKREKHVVEEHGAHRFQCAQCGQSFCTQRTLDQHLQRAHALDPTTPSTQSTQAQVVAVQRNRQPRQIAPSIKTTQQAASEQQMQQRRKCYLQQRPTWLERRNRTAASIASSAAAAASNSQTSMVRVEDVHLQVYDDAAKGKKSIDLQLDTTQLTAESTTTTNELSHNGSTPSSSGNKPQRILCCPDCDDPFNEEHTHVQPSGELQSHEQQQQQLELQQQQQEQQLREQQLQPREQLDQQEDDEEEDGNEHQVQQQPLQREEQLPKPLAKSAHVTLPSPEQTEPDSTSSTNNTAILRQFRKRRASSKYAGMAALLAARGSSNSSNGSSSSALLAAVDKSNATEDELLLMERVLRNSHNCLFCDARFTNDVALRKHHQLAHSNQATMPFVCSICKRGFRMRTALQRHMETHDSEGRPYECTLCHVRFPRPSQLTLHKLTVHFLRKPHSCGVCGKQFGTESALKTHSTFHQGHMKTHLPIGALLSEDDVLQLPQCQQQQEQQQSYRQQQEFEGEKMTAAEEQEQQPQIEIEQPQQDEHEQQQQHQDLEQLLEDETQDMAVEPQTSEPQAGNDDNNEDVTAMAIDCQ